ncbi:hypothetical protein [Rugamonas sp. DEMB1]|uniref:hypothetical protein n=1 Tax=Rugamonas sp. DEMB1 TaxID=3039386 RepID=UPI00244CAAF7|nr:hypothetical protein [Rugamonas sp. DEMB1]WGG48952.1 hypothetical protein QC826_20205 [Rugamonas sp. DEMB1]
MSNKAFSIFLQDMRDGRTHTELTKCLDELLAAVKNTGKGGSLSVEIKIKPASRGQDVDKVVITDKVSIKVPSPERGDDFYWLTDDHELSRNHPKQTTLDLRDASSAPPTNLKEASK